MYVTCPLRTEDQDLGGRLLEGRRELPEEAVKRGGEVETGGEVDIVRRMAQGVCGGACLLVQKSSCTNTVNLYLLIRVGEAHLLFPELAIRDLGEHNLSSFPSFGDVSLLPRCIGPLGGGTYPGRLRLLLLELHFRAEYDYVLCTDAGRQFANRPYFKRVKKQRRELSGQSTSVEDRAEAGTSSMRINMHSMESAQEGSTWYTGWYPGQELP